jgi:hypothetical protein
MTDSTPQPSSLSTDRAPDLSPGIAGRHPVQIEVIFVRPDQSFSDALAYRLVQSPLLEGAFPDDAAAALCQSLGGDTGKPAVEVLHSTSWRHDPAQGVVLTYAALPDPRPDLPAAALHAPSVVCSGDALRPTPDILHDHHIAAHAVRHLSYLVDHDPGMPPPSNAHTWRTSGEPCDPPPRACRPHRMPWPTTRPSSPPSPGTCVQHPDRPPAAG